MLTTTWPKDPFTRSELHRLGLSTGALRAGLRDGEVRAVLRGVFVAADAEQTIELRVRCVAKVVKPHHVITDRTAAWVLGIDVYVFGELDSVPSIETCALRGHQPTRQDGVDGRTRDLRPEDVTVVGGVRVTTPLRTALDLGCCLRRREAYAALNAFAREFGLTRHDMLRAARRFRGRRGVVQLRELIALLDSRIESQRESWVFLEIVSRGLAAPEPQVWIEVDGVPTYRLDFAYRRRRVCVEYDGFEAHELTEDQRRRDRDRRAWLRANGWTVIVVRNGDFTDAALERWVGELREALSGGYDNRRW